MSLIKYSCIKNARYNVLCVYVILQNTFAAIEEGGKVRDRFNVMVRFKGGLRCNGRVRSILVICSVSAV